MTSICHTDANSGGDSWVIRTEDLGRSFGARVAVHSISLAVRRGEIFGMLGPNGAGKSTMVRMLCGILLPTSGRGQVLGFDIATQAERIKHSIGYMTQRSSLYEDLTIEENLWFYGGIYGLPRQERHLRREAAIERLGLQERRKQIVSTLSGGWKQRVALACTTLHNPSLLFLDEPTAGVDPVNRRGFWLMVHHLIDQGTTVVITTHYMDEAERCHRLAFLSRGTVLACGTPAELLERSGLHLLEIDLPGYAIAATKVLAQRPEVDEVSPFGDTLRVAFHCSEPEQFAVQLLREFGIPFTAMRPVRTSIEDACVSLLRDEMLDTMMPAQKKP